MTAAKETMRNNAAIIMVALNKSLSTPRLVVYTELAPPKAEPKPEPFCCKSTTTIMATDKIICKIENTVFIGLLCARSIISISLTLLYWPATVNPVEFITQVCYNFHYMELTSVPPVAPRKHHPFLVGFGVLFVIFLVTFFALMAQYLWQFKYGTLEQNAATYNQFNAGKFSKGSNNTNPPQAPATGWEALTRASDPRLGIAKSKVTVVAFIDFECPFSQDNYETFSQVLETYGGGVNIVFKSLPLANLHPNALPAAEAAACANAQGKFWDFYHFLFNSKKLTAADLDAAGQAVGLDMTTFTQCRNSHQFFSAIEQDVKDASSLGVRGTPTYFINNEVFEGGTDRTTWDAAILRNLKS